MQKIIVGNLKMNLISAAERERYFEAFKKELEGEKLENSQIVLCVPSVHLESFVKKLKKEIISIGLQNIFWEEKGSYTGEISASMIVNMGAEYVIIGHSERRRYFGETNSDANLKIIAALKNKLSPIYCVGETRDEKNNGSASQIIIEQIKEGFANISAIKALDVIIAYEPVWAVGSDVLPTSNEILEVKILLKKIFAEMYSLEIAERIRVIYGGSVKAESVKQVCLDPGMDGVLVGRESLAPRDFFKIVSAIEKE